MQRQAATEHAERGRPFPQPERAERRGGPVTGAEDVVSAFGTAWSEHDLDGALAWCSEDCLFESTGPAPDGVEHRGHDALRAAWRAIFDDVSSRFEIEESIALGEHMVQRWRYDWGSGHVRGVDLFVVRDGKIVEKRSYVKG